LWAKFQILTVLGAVFPHFCPDKCEIWHGGADLRAALLVTRTQPRTFCQRQGEALTESSQGVERQALDQDKDFTFVLTQLPKRQTCITKLINTANTVKYKLLIA